MTRFKLGLPWAAVATCMALGFLIVVAGSVRTGGIIIALGLLAGAAMRAALPLRYVSDLAVRSRAFDVGGYLFLAVLTFVAFTGVKL